MREIVLSLNPLRAAATANISLFLEFLDLFEYTSNKDLLSVKSCKDICFHIILLTFSASEIVTSGSSLKEITSSYLADWVTRVASNNLKNNAAAASVFSPRKQICPSRKDISWFLANEASEKPMTLKYFRSSLGLFRSCDFWQRTSKRSWADRLVYSFSPQKIPLLPDLAERSQKMQLGLVSDSQAICILINRNSEEEPSSGSFSKLRK